MTMSLSTPVDTFGTSTVKVGVSITSADYQTLRSDLLQTTRKPAAKA